MKIIIKTLSLVLLSAVTVAQNSCTGSARNYGTPSSSSWWEVWLFVSYLDYSTHMHSLQLFAHIAWPIGVEETHIHIQMTLRVSLMMSKSMFVQPVIWESSFQMVSRNCGMYDDFERAIIHRQIFDLQVFQIMMLFKETQTRHVRRIGRYQWVLIINPFFIISCTFCH